MRMLGYVLWAGGFLWLAQDAAIGFTDYQYATGWCSEEENGR